MRKSTIRPGTRVDKVKSALGFGLDWIRQAICSDNTKNVREPARTLGR